MKFGRVTRKQNFVSLRNAKGISTVCRAEGIIELNHRESEDALIRLFLAIFVFRETKYCLLNFAVDSFGGAISVNL